MNWKNKKVLVTGGGGFIGSHLIERLCAEGANVRAFIRYNSRSNMGCIGCLSSEIKKSIEIISGDITELVSVEQAVKGMEIVFHLAASIGIPYSYIHPREVVETNLMGSLNIFTAAREMNIEKVVHTSTSEVYGTAQYVPIDENHPIQSQSPYSASKVGADALAMSFVKAFGCPFAIIRPFNTFGPRQSMRAIIPTIITQALKKNDIQLGSLSPTRSFTYVSDIVDGFIKIAESDKSIGNVINIGTDIEISIGDLANKIVALMGKKIKVICTEERIRSASSEVQRLCADNSKAKALLGWEPKIGLDEGLKKTISWISEFHQLYDSDKYAV
ncbi:MAG: SDR family NAD(P)-dependent oxidoreductase [Sedimentisphaerales bacterium]|jgi:NAD dependent epimerase/dehydratase